MRSEVRLEVGNSGRKAVGSFPVQDQGGEVPEHMHSSVRAGGSDLHEARLGESGQSDLVKDVLGQLEAYRDMLEARDGLVRRAREAGLSEVQIAKATGHSRTTVRNILARIPPA